MKKFVLDENLISDHVEKLKYWLGLLNEVMPDYFFNTFTPKQIHEIIPALFNIHRQSGIQRIATEDSVILLYLKSRENNMISTANMMNNFNVSGAVVHKSIRPIIIKGVPRTIIIEYFKIGKPSYKIPPVFAKKYLLRKYKSRFNEVPSDLEEMYERINWEAVRDLDIERLVGRLHRALKVQSEDWIEADIEKAGKNELRLTMALSNCPQKGFYHKIIECLAKNGFEVFRSYVRQITYQENRNDLKKSPVTVITFYSDGINKSLSLNSNKLKDLLHEITHVEWVSMGDILHSMLVVERGWSLSSANLFRAAGEFIHSQFSFIDRNAYNSRDIFRLMGLYEPILKDMMAFFIMRFEKEKVSCGNRKFIFMKNKILNSIKAINSGIHEKDTMLKNIFTALLEFFMNIEKTNYFVEKKTALSFRLNPEFMKFYEALSPDYKKSFPEQRPYGVFYFFRDHCIGFHVRFSDIARGGWRTVIPQNVGHELERKDSYSFAKDEIFREVYVLAHTQHMKNKDIYEGGAKMICLINKEDQEFPSFLYEAQRSFCRAFMDLINYDDRGVLKTSGIVDYLGKSEIIELGPDENMSDLMINWISEYAEKSAYVLGGGIISGKVDAGINHKEYGVTSLGVIQYLDRILKELKIDPEKDPFSVKISGGPFGDVAGNVLNLLLKKKKNSYVFPKLKIVAITDGPAAAYDPDGLDREEILSLVKKKNLDSFSPKKLKGQGAYIIYSEPIANKVEKYKLILRFDGKLQEKMVSRDEYMKIFQETILIHYADIFMPCGGRPDTINISNWESFLANSIPTSKAIIEGANSFITQEARDKLQEKGIWIIKDASANKCGVITSSYEILSGLMLEKEEFRKEKNIMVKQILDILKERAQKEADWLFFHHKRTGKPLTQLTEQLSYEINHKNDEIREYIETHPELVRNDIILRHLPRILSEKYSDRLNKIPMGYRKAIVSVELACSIIYKRVDNLENEIESALE